MCESSLIPCFKAFSLIIIRLFASRSFMFTLDSSSSILPASTLERSRISLISWSRWRPLTSTLLMYLVCFSFSSPKVWSHRISEKPIMALRGVRSSWLILARNSLLVRVAVSAASLAFCNCSSACLRLIFARVTNKEPIANNTTRTASSRRSAPKTLCDAAFRISGDTRDTIFQK